MDRLLPITTFFTRNWAIGSKQCFLTHLDDPITSEQNVADIKQHTKQ